MQWLYGLFLDLIAYCANALLGVMSTDLAFFENSVPIVPNLYKVFVAIGWGLLIGNCVFQSMKAMFAGMGAETESPVILLMRTFLFGTLLIFSKDICDIGLSLGKNVIVLLGIPTEVTLTMPDESYFTGGASWLLVIIVGFILGFQLIKLFFEIAERYVVVAILTLLCPVGLAMGGSKSTKDICTGFIRTYASMIVMMVLNVLFLKLILSALSTMPSGALVLPWCLLVVGIARTARKADQLISKIGMNPANTGDPLGTGRGMMTTLIAARTIMSLASSRVGRNGRIGSNRSSAQNYSGNANSISNNSAYNTNTGNYSSQSVNNGGQNRNNSQAINSSQFGANNSSSANANNSNFGGIYNNPQSNSINSGFTMGSQNINNAGAFSNISSQPINSSRFGASNYNSSKVSAKNSVGNAHIGNNASTKVNTNRFGVSNVAGTAVKGGPIVKNNSPIHSSSTQKGNTVNGPISKGNTVHNAPTQKGNAINNGSVQKGSIVNNGNNVGNAKNVSNKSSKNEKVISTKSNPANLSKGITGIGTKADRISKGNLLKNTNNKKAVKNNASSVPQIPKSKAENFISKSNRFGSIQAGAIKHNKNLMKPSVDNTSVFKNARSNSLLGNERRITPKVFDVSITVDDNISDGGEDNGS